MRSWNCILAFTFILLSLVGSASMAQSFQRKFLADSLNSYRWIDSLESAWLRQGEVRPGALDTLAHIYDLGHRERPGTAAEFLQRKAFLAQRFPDHFSDRLSLWLDEAIAAAPQSCSLQLFRFWAAGIETQKFKGLNAWRRPAQTWARYDRLLYARELLRPKEAEPTFRTRIYLHRIFQAKAPACDASSQLLEKAISASDKATCLIFMSLHGCQLPELWPDNPNGFSAWNFRLLANQFQSPKQQERYLTLLDLAIQNEDIPVLEADYHALKAHQFRLTKKYAAAKRELKWAIDLAPNWGELYLKMADLYLEGRDRCKLNDFDQKAVYWLAIDLAQKAINSSPSLSEEANQRIFEYRRLMPQPKEAQFRGLQEGATWPIRCWINGVTTVKFE